MARQNAEFNPTGTDDGVNFQAGWASGKWQVRTAVTKMRRPPFARYEGVEDGTWQGSP